MTLYMSKAEDCTERIGKINSLEERSFTKNLRKYIRQYNDVTGIHGLRYLTEKRSLPEKIFWAVIVLVSLGGCVYMILEIVEKYQSSPVVVSFGTECTPIHQIPFPTVTICPESKYSGSLFNYSQIYHKILNDSFDDIGDVNVTKFFHLSLLCEDDDEVAMRANLTENEDFFETINELKVNPLTLVSCAFMGEIMTCDKLFKPILTDQGTCYSFNMINRSEIVKDHVYHPNDYYITSNISNSFNLHRGYAPASGINVYPRRALSSGEDHGLIVFFTYDLTDADYVCSSFFQGWRVLIHGPFDMPRLTQNYFRVPLDKVVVAAMEPELITTSEEVREFSPAKRKCYMLNERPLKHFKIYTQSNCMLECITNYTLQHCKCVAFYMPRDKGAPICGSGSFNCIKDADKQLRTQNLEAEISGSASKLICDCKPACANLKFKVETSHSDFYFSKYFHAHNKQKILDETRDHWSILSVYFKSDVFIPIQRNQLYGVSDLISNFGGLLGLFTGFSLISLAEIFYFLTIRIYYNVRLYGIWSGSSN